MILVDTSVWVDHLRRGDAAMVDLLNQRAVLVHPFVMGEVALGYLRQRQTVIGFMQRLRLAVVASDYEVLGFIERHELHGLGIGYVDAHLLAAVRLTPEAVLWTRDKRLHAAAARLSMAADLD